MQTGRFVAIGDSFTEGVGDPNAAYPNGFRGWADRLARQLGRADPDWEYANLALRSRLLDEIVAHQVEPALALRPTVLSFFGGGNDLLGLRSDLDDLLERLDETIDVLTRNVPRVLVFTAYDRPTARLLTPLRRRIEGYNAGVREIAASRGAQLLDHTLHREFDHPWLWSVDKLHMSRWGHKRMAAIVLRELEIRHTLRIRDLEPWARRPLHAVAREETAFVRGEVLPLVRRRLSGRRPSDAASPKWPDPIRPAEGMKRLAREQLRTLSGSASR